MDDGWALPGIIERSVSIFDIVDRKVWLAVGGVFRDGTAAIVFFTEGGRRGALHMPATSMRKSAE